MFAKIQNGKITWYQHFKKKELSVNDILWAYLQQEDVNARMCCANTSFAIGRLIVIKKDHSKEIFQYDGMDKPKELLNMLKTENPEIAIGFTKENKEKFLQV